MSRSALLVVVAAVVVGGCSGGDGDSTAPETGTHDTGPPAVERYEELAVIGAGRALAAASADGTDTLVAATTGVVFTDGTDGGQPLDVEFDGAPSDVEVSPDGRHAVVIAAGIGAEIWSLDGPPARIAVVPGVFDASFNDDDATAIMTTESDVSAVSLANGESTALITTPAGSVLTGSAAPRSGDPVAAVVSGDSSGADLRVYRRESGVIAIDAFTEPGWEIARAELDQSGDHAVLSVTTGDPFEGALVGLDTSTGAIEWEVDAGPSALEETWAIGADGRILLASDTRLQLLGADGATITEAQLPAPLSATSVVATRSGYAVALTDGSITFTDLDGVMRTTVVASGGPLTSVQSIAGADGIVAVDTSGVVRAWDGSGALLSENSAFASSPVNDVAISADGTSVAFGTSGGDARVTDTLGTRSPVSLRHPEGSVNSIAFSPDQSTLLTGVGERLTDISFDDTVSLWRLDDDTRFYEFGGEGEDVNGCANFRNTVEFAADGNTFAASSHDFTVSLHRSDTGELLHEFPPHLSTVLDLSFSPTGDRLVTTSDDGAVRIWSLADYQLITEFTSPPGGYWSVAYLPDDQRLVVGDLTGAVSIIDSTDGSTLITFDGTKSRMSDIAVSADGSTVAAGSDGNAVRVWSTGTGAQLVDLMGHGAPVTSVAFSTDGMTLVSGSEDSTVRVWNLA